MFDSLLVANRGEIARRVIRTANRLGLRTDRGPFGRRRRPAVRRGSVPGGAARPGGRRRVVPQRRGRAEGGAGQRGGGDPPRLRVSLRERRVRPRGDRRRVDLGRSEPGGDPGDGRQDRRPQRHAGGRGTGRARHARPARRRGDGRGRRRRDRLPGDDQGLGRRRRDGDGRGGDAGPAGRRVREGDRVRRPAVRRPGGVRRALLPAGAARRGADPGPGRRSRAGAGGAGLLRAAAQPEGGRGDPVTGGRRRPARADAGRGAAGRRGGRLRRRRHGGVPADC